METAFQEDFSTVRLHEGPAARSAGVRAYASGEDIHTSPGALRLDTPGGRELLGHELAHVLQQRAGMAGRGTEGTLERAAERAGSAAAEGRRVSSVGSAAAGSPGPAAVSGPALSGLSAPSGPAQAGRYKVGPPPATGKTDSRKEVEAFHQGGDVYVDAGANRYQLVTTTAGDYLSPVSAQSTDASLAGGSSMKSLLGGGRAKKLDLDLSGTKGKVLQRPIYTKAEELAEKARKGDAAAKQSILEIGKLNDPRHPDHKKSKEEQDRWIRDKAVKRKGENRGTGNDEGQETFLFTTALTRDSGLSKDPGIRPVDKGSHGQEITRMMIHQSNRTPTSAVPLIGGPGHNHPGVATSSSGGQDHLNKGNAELDQVRAEAILSHHGPVSEWGASMVAQVHQMKPPREVIDPTKVMGFDPRGRELDKDPEARQDLAYASGRNREVMKRVVKKLRNEYGGASPMREDTLSSDDESFPIDDKAIEDVVIDPRKLPLLYNSYEDPKSRPSGWKYTGKKRKRDPNKS